MAEKLSAIGLVVLASDFDHVPTRNALSAAALGMAITGSIRGEYQRREHYDPTANQMIEEARYNLEQASLQLPA